MWPTPSDDPLLQDTVVCRTAHGLHFLDGVGHRLLVSADRVVALEQASGQPLWNVALPFAAPVTYEAIVRAGFLVISGAGLLCALHIETGAVAWRGAGNLVALRS